MRKNIQHRYSQWKCYQGRESTAKNHIHKVVAARSSRDAMEAYLKVFGHTIERFKDNYIITNVTPCKNEYTIYYRYHKEPLILCCERETLFVDYEKEY